MQRILFTISLLLSSLFIYAFDVAGSLSGTIKDAITGEPISNANIFLSDIKVGTTSDATGHYSLQNIGNGTHLLEISHVGYSTLAITVEISGDKIQNFSLQEAIVENNAVVVTGVSKATQLKNLPYQVAIIRKEELQQNTATNIIEALAKKPGVSTLSTGPAISKPFIRGLGYNRVLTINDGVRQEGQQWGDEHGVEIDDNSVQKIEILKGPATLIYGSDAMAGVINVITNVPVSLNTWQASVGAEGQSNNSLLNFHGSVASNKDGLSFNLYGSTKSAGDYQNKYDGYVYNSKYQNTNVGGYLGVNKAWGYSHLIFSSFHLKAGLIEGERNDDGLFLKPLPGGAEAIATNSDFKSRMPGIPYQNIRHEKIALDNNIRIGQNNLAVNVGLQRNRREEFGDIDEPETQELFFDLKTITYSAKLNFKKVSGFKPSIGVNGMDQRNTNRGEEQLIPDYRLHEIGAFAFADKTIQKVTLSGGIRYDYRNLKAQELLDGTSVKGEAFDRNFKNLSASLGMAYAATKAVNLKFNIASAYRSPSIPELASNGSHEGTNRYEYGLRDLDNERSIQVDGAVEINNKHFSLQVAGFVNNFSNFIFYKRLQASAGGDSIIVVDGEPLQAFTFAQQKAALAGTEITLDIHPHAVHWLHFANTFSFVSGTFSEAIQGVKYLPNIPAPRLLTELRADFENLSTTLNGSYIKLELDNTFAKNNVFTAFNTETATPGYSLLNFGLGTDVLTSKKNKLFTINFSVNNMLDKAYQNHLSRLKYTAENLATGRMGIFNAGRNFALKLAVPLGGKW